MRGKILNDKLFKAFCIVLDDDVSVLLFYIDVKWLSRGHVLTRLFKRKIEIEYFLKDKKSFLVHTFESPNFAAMWAYLEDAFQNLNDLNLSVQQKRANIVTACD